jgi:integrase
MPLTDLAVRQAKARKTPYKLSDGGGLFLQVTTSGGKLWRLKYRFVGKEKLLSFGPYPTVSLADAREAREAAKKALINGVDPSEQRRSDKRTAEAVVAQTFGLVADEFIAKAEAQGRAGPTVAKSRWILKRLAAPLKNRPISLIKPAEILDVLRRIEAKGNHETARRCRATISRVFRYAISTGRAESDPAAALVGALVAPRVKHHAAITKPAKVGELLRAIDGLEGGLVVKCALQLMALCFPRPGELRQAEWTEIDLDQAIWVIPAERAKMRRAHKIPLAPQSVAILRRLKEITGRGRLAFPGVRTPSRPLSENTLNVALRRLGYSTEEMTSHGFRTTASTLLNESGLWHADAIERALAHQDADSVRRAYARGEYWDERVRMAEWWADHLDALKMGREARLDDKAERQKQPRTPKRTAPAATPKEQLSLFGD